MSKDKPIMTKQLVDFEVSIKEIRDLLNKNTRFSHITRFFEKGESGIMEEVWADVEALNYGWLWNTYPQIGIRNLLKLRVIRDLFNLEDDVILVEREEYVYEDGAYDFFERLIHKVLSFTFAPESNPEKQLSIIFFE